MTAIPPIPRRLAFNRHELAGAFGDLGTDLPLIVGMVLAAGLDPASVLVAFGTMQVFTGLVYRLPMPVQPLKAVAAIVIAQRLPPGVIYGAGLAIGIVMLLLTVLGLIDWLARVVPKAVIRGIQLGLGIQLASIALGRFVPAEGTGGLALAAAAFVLVVTLLGNGRLPAALPVLALGAIWGLLVGSSVNDGAVLGFTLPILHVPAISDIVTGFVVLALPQLPLSLGNSILATRQVVRDYYPDVDLSVRRIAFTYSVMNLVNPWVGGIPTCHGSGGFAGHYTFGGRTGGSVVLYGACFLGAGLFLSGGFGHLLRVFPLPVLGVLLLFEALALIVLVRDLAGDRAELALAGLVGLVAAFLPYGYVVGLVVGTVLAHLGRHRVFGVQQQGVVPTRSGG